MNNGLRKAIVEVAYKTGEGHIPSAFSILEILSTLYGKFLHYDNKNPNWDGRDYFILSKGHGCLALYAILQKYGFISESQLFEIDKSKRILGGHPDCTKIPGVEASTGSLGHGLGIGLGIALGLKIKQKNNRVIVLVGDGECNEGTIWESALVASNLNLGNLCVIVDNNKSSENVLPVPEPKKKWESFGWEVYEIGGHNEEKLLSVLNSLSFNCESKPKVIIADTIKGKGVSFIENNGIWHHKIPNLEELDKIEKELENE